MIACKKEASDKDVLSISLTVDSANVSDGVLEIVKIVKPSWDLEYVELKVSVPFLIFLFLNKFEICYIFTFLYYISPIKLCKIYVTISLRCIEVETAN